MCPVAICHVWVINRSLQINLVGILKWIQEVAGLYPCWFVASSCVQFMDEMLNSPCETTWSELKGQTGIGLMKGELRC